MEVHLKSILTPMFGVSLFLTAVTGVSETVDIVPKMLAVKRGQKACFNCTTTYQEAHWMVGEGVPFNGRPNHVNGLTFTKHCFNVTKNTNVTCIGETPGLPHGGVDKVEVTVIEDDRNATIDVATPPTGQQGGHISIDDRNATIDVATPPTGQQGGHISIGLFEGHCALWGL